MLKYLLKEDKLEASEGCKEEPSEGETHPTHSLSLSLVIRCRQAKGAK